MEASTTVTLTHQADISVGDKVSIPVPENRWWVRAWYFLTFRQAPARNEVLIVTGVTGGGTVLNVTQGP